MEEHFLANVMVRRQRIHDQDGNDQTMRKGNTKNREADEVVKDEKDSQLYVKALLL